MLCTVHVLRTGSETSSLKVLDMVDIVKVLYMVKVLDMVDMVKVLYTVKVVGY
jgi:hypothetical protein